MEFSPQSSTWRSEKEKKNEKKMSVRPTKRQSLFLVAAARSDSFNQSVLLYSDFPTPNPHLKSLGATLARGKATPLEKVERFLKSQRGVSYKISILFQSVWRLRDDTEFKIDFLSLFYQILR